MTTADRHTETDPHHGGGAYRASEVDVTAQDDAARYEGVDGTVDGTADGTGREPGGYAQRHGDDTTADSAHDTGHDATSADPSSTDTTATDEPRTDGGYPHDADSVDHSGADHTRTDHTGTDHTGTDHTGSDVDGHASGRHADSGMRTVDVGSDTDDRTDHSGGAAGPDKLERLVPGDRVDAYSARWDAVKGEFVDEPRQAVAKADKLVGELLDELDQLFRKQRSDLEHGLDADETSTEDLRLALRRYRSFFDRLLAL
ncbi:MSCRAMM family adhesin SdrC [Pseudonocardia lacus]|uniref:MSCRAMM family adhesin SdrC n=1 Tax=Pseudonocardia lacus TaxID=2835865 RepID=UPI001BDDBF16|nr:MSCRAMM family adhesin SdrC [Pseudonocardia lacus]